tara:strand:- start:92 stop:346 length:255 start_codon:yes stop_codon:yes gene_type:complete
LKRQEDPNYSKVKFDSYLIQEEDENRQEGDYSYVGNEQEVAVGDTNVKYAIVENSLNPKCAISDNTNEAVTRYFESNGLKKCDS